MAIVRIATEQDLPRILELYEELTGEQHHLSSEDVQLVFAEIISMSGHELLVAEESGVVVGTMVLLILPNLSHGALPWAIIENMVVDGRYRRRRIGHGECRGNGRARGSVGSRGERRCGNLPPPAKRQRLR